MLPRLQVGQKRGRSQLEELNAEVLDGTKRKKIRLVSLFECGSGLGVDWLALAVR